MEVPLLKDIFLIFALAVAVLLVCHRLRVATVVGFLVTGIVVGPHGLGLVSTAKEVEILAEIGVILLLFSIGIEFSLENLLRVKRTVFLGGLLQVAATILFSYVLFRILGVAPGPAVFIGFLISLSSTAIVLRLLQQRAEMESPHGQTSVAILIFQDLAVVPMMILTPFLAGTHGQGSGSGLFFLVKGLAVLLVVVLAAKWVIPKLLYFITRTRSREVFMLCIFTICFAVAFLTHHAGLSLALGAFLAGLIISETEFSHETLGTIIPFRDVFTSLFFVSIGMLMDVNYLFQHPVQITLLSLSTMVLKSLFCCGAVIALGFSLRTALLAGLALGQIGEFSFILFKTGTELGLLEPRFYQLFLNVTVLTMGLTPFAIALAPRLSDAVVDLRIPLRLKDGLYGKLLEEDIPKDKLRDHLIIVGFGFNGINLANAAQAAGISYVIIEMNPQTVHAEKKKGQPIYYGDASQEAVLEHANIRDARILVVVISDPIACRKITAAARKGNPNLYILVRTRFVTETKRLLELGANQVIPEEFETAIEILSGVLAKYRVPRDQIHQLITEARAGGYEMLRTPSGNLSSLCDLEFQIPDMDIGTFRVSEGAELVGKTLEQIAFRKQYGATVLAVYRGTRTLPNPSGETVVEAKDLMVVFAPPVKMAGLMQLFKPPKKTEAKGALPPDVSDPSA